MKKLGFSMLVLVALAVTVGLLTAAAAAPVPPEKKCFNADGEEIPCPNSNYLQTQKAIRDASRDSGPTSAAVYPTFTPSPTPTLTPTPTNTTAPTEAAAAGAPPVQVAQPPAAPPPETAPPPSTLQVLVPLLMLGCAGLIGVFVLVVVVRWLTSRRSASPGPPAAQ